MFISKLNFINRLDEHTRIEAGYNKEHLRSIEEISEIVAHKLRLAF
jgi:hypothetical protein